MPRDFLPAADAALLIWAENFSGRITLAPTSYTLTALIATTLATKVSTYSTTLSAAKSAATRGVATVFAKNVARADLVAYIRQLAGVIQKALTVTNSQRLDLNLPIHHTHPTPINPPASAPDVDVISAVGRTVRIRLHTAGSLSHRGKPPGVAGATVYSFVGATPPADLVNWKTEGMVTRNIVDVVFPLGAAAGAMVWICARWQNPRGQQGPASTPISTNIPGGLTTAEAA